MDEFVKNYYNIVQYNIFKYNNNFNKAKGLPIGTVRNWGGVNYKKFGINDWRKIGKQKKNVERGEEYNEKTFERYYDFHEKYYSKFREYVSELAEKYNGDAVVPPPKTKSGSYEKVNNDYDGDHTKLKDILRATLVVENSEKALNVYNDLRKNNKVHKAHFDFNNPAYQGANVVIEKDNRKMEIQINTPYNLALKDNDDFGNPAIKRNLEMLNDAGFEPGVGHKYYEILRSNEDNPEVYEQVKGDMAQYYSEGREFLTGSKFGKSIDFY